MTTYASSVHDYATAAAYLAEGKRGAATEDRPLPSGHSTRLQRRDARTIAVRLHATDIVIYSADGSATLYSGGWRTVTTKARINEYAPRAGDGTPWRLSQWRGAWTLSLGGWQDPERLEVPFFEGMRIRDDKVTNAPTAAAVAREAKRTASMLAAIRRYVDGYMTAYAKGLPAPGPGDCWYCSMFDRDGRDPEHLREHLRERYYVPSIIRNAIRARGYTGDYEALHLGLTEDGERLVAERSILGTATLRRALTKYLRAALAPQVAR